MKKITLILIGFAISMACISSASAAVFMDSHTNDLDISSGVCDELISNGGSTHLASGDLNQDSSPSANDNKIDGLNDSREIASNENNQTNLSANADKNPTSSENSNWTSVANQDRNSSSVVVPGTSMGNDGFYFGFLMLTIMKAMTASF